MPLTTNRLWRFFASVKLALMTLFVLATTSIFGTVIKQNKPTEFYIEEYGALLARIFDLLDITTMYSSWWFIGLLLVFALNLIVCSIERLPGVWRTVVQDNSTVSEEQIKKMALSQSYESRLDPAAATAAVEQALSANGWKRPQQKTSADNALLFVQRGAWTRLAVYAVHLSILVILAGAAIGFLFGFKAYIYLPEGRSSDTVFLQENQKPVALDFSIFVDHAKLSFYPNGMIREYRASLTVTDPQKTASYHKSIVVNDPLTYRGTSFYLGDFYPMEEFYVVITNRTTGEEQAFRAPAERDLEWPGTEITARIEELARADDGSVQRARMSFATTPETPATEFWISNEGIASVSQAGKDFSFTFRQFNSVLLLVNKDPGVTIVYVGFILMILSLFVSFFLSHRRIWISLAGTRKGTRIIVGGSSNKNRPGFEKAFNQLAEQIRKTL